MRKLNTTEQQAFSQRRQSGKAPVAVWYVKIGRALVYENASIQLCWYYIKQNSLKTKPTSIK